MDIKPGDTVTVEDTRGQATGNPVTTVVTGVVYRDSEGTLTVAYPEQYGPTVSLERDSEGYFPRGVVILSVVHN